MNSRHVLSTRFQPTAPKAAKFTIWHNPLTVAQRVDVWEGEDYIRYEIPAGGTERIPSRFDVAIHRVQCAEDTCRASGGFCTQGHPGVVHGGLAPQLQRKGQEEEFVLAKGLDTEAERRDEVELASAAAAEKVRRAEVESILAQKRADDLKAQASSNQNQNSKK